VCCEALCRVVSGRVGLTFIDQSLAPSRDDARLSDLNVKRGDLGTGRIGFSKPKVLRRIVSDKSPASEN
jgi:hypothetical protein